MSNRGQSVLMQPVGLAPLRSGHPIDGDCVFLSDVHLFEPEDEATAVFLSVLQAIGERQGHFRDVRHVFLVGDVFEFIDGSAPFFRRLWKNVFDALAELRARDIHVYFIEGNHDFGFEHRGPAYNAHEQPQGLSPGCPWSSQWATFAGDAGLHFEHPALGSLHVRHGDDVVSEPGYLYFRAFVKSAGARRLLRLLPSAPAHRFFLAFAKLSRRAGSGYHLTLAKIHRDVRRFFQRHRDIPLRTMVIGHIHVHLDTIVDGVRVLAGPDWHTAPSYLVIGAGGEVQRLFVDSKRTVPVLGEAAEA